MRFFKHKLICNDKHVQCKAVKLSLLHSLWTHVKDSKRRLSSNLCTDDIEHNRLLQSFKFLYLILTLSLKHHGSKLIRNIWQFWVAWQIWRIPDTKYSIVYEVTLQQLIATSIPAIRSHKFRTQQQIYKELRNKTVNLRIVIRIKSVGATRRQALHKSHRLT